MANVGVASLTAISLSTTAPSNVALNKTATQSSTHNSAVASRAVDGNTDGVFANGSVTHTLNDLNAWWHVDLGQVEAIGTIKIWNRVELPERLSNFYVFVSDVPFTSTNLTTTQNQAGVSTFYTAGQCGFPTELAINRTARYIRVQLGGTNYLSIAEVQVWTGSGASPIQWFVTDQLGTPRIILDQSGSLANVKRHDYLPFGEELFAPTGGRTTAQGYSLSDDVRQKFTSKERDFETGLDYFGERYYGSTLGRFTSADPLMASAKTGNPQTWNRFTYVLNNPLRYVDPDGMEPTDPWSQLTSDEQNIIAPKLPVQSVPMGGTQTRLETSQEAFNRLVGTGTAEQIEAKVVTVKNFIDSAGGHSNGEVWQGIQTLESIDLGRNPTTGGIEGRVSFSVDNKEKFLTTLSNNGYDVDRYYEMAGNHKYNTARERTSRFGLPGIHFANDTPGKPNLFYAHWDRISSAFDGCCDYTTLKEGQRVMAGQTHKNPYTPQELRIRLKEIGKVPRNEP